MYSQTSRDRLFTEINCSFEFVTMIATYLTPFLEQNPYIQEKGRLDSANSFVNGYEYMQHTIFQLNKRIPVNIINLALEHNKNLEMNQMNDSKLLNKLEYTNQLNQMNQMLSCIFLC